MAMSERQRMLAVYRGETPDRVPFFLDLSHWFYQRHGLPFDLSVAGNLEAERQLFAYHHKMGVGYYVANLSSFYDVIYPDDVLATTRKEMTPEGPELVWRIETPIGSIERRRLWEDQSYSWFVTHWGVESADDLRVLAYAFGQRRFEPAWERYATWVEGMGDLGVVYMPTGYSAMGHLLSLWMGIEHTIFAAYDLPETLHEVVDTINANQLELVDMVCRSPADVIFMGDNFSGDVQSPSFFKEWSEPYYREAIRRIAAAGKFSAVHIDGNLRGILRAFANLGASCADAVTPAPMFDLSPAECRREAGPNMVLSGGVPPNVWIEETSDEEFRETVLRWLEIRKLSPRLVAAAGDQVPPGAPEYRIEMMRELVEAYGRF